MKLDEAGLVEALGERLEGVKSIGPTATGGLAASGYTTILGTKIGLEVQIGSNFPAELPSIFLRSPLPKRIPHVTNNGFVCFDRSIGLIIDRYDPKAVVEQALGRALKIIEDGLAGRNTSEFVTEFKPTWSQIGPNVPAFGVFSLVEPTGGVRAIHVVFGKRAQSASVGLKAFLDDEAKLASLRRMVLVEEPILGPAVFVPLRPPIKFNPPSPNRSWLSRDIKDFIEDNLEKSERRELHRLLGATPKAPVLIAVPRAASQPALVGFLALGASGQHPLIAGREIKPPIFFTATRLDRGYLLPRGGAETGLSHKQVLLIGCGSLGSRIAELIASSGIGVLTLVDPDSLSTDNLYRHVLGTHLLDIPKVIGLATELGLRYPHLEVKPIQKNILHALKDGDVTFESFDLVISATGEPSVELELNARLSVLPKAPLAVYTWLEPLGLGGHALLTVPGKTGCFECLIQPACHPETPLYNRASFMAASQPGEIVRDLDGCGGAFTPFSALDAARTAELAARVALRALEDLDPKSQLASWRGDPGRFVQAGFVLGDRHHNSSENPVLLGHEFVRQDCPICKRAD